MPAIDFHADAAEEMQAAAASYAARARGLGDEFLDEIEQGLRRIEQFPRLWSIYDGAYRRYLLSAFRTASFIGLTQKRYSSLLLPIFTGNLGIGSIEHSWCWEAGPPLHIQCCAS